ncbi:hypothetical protein [Priestia megaterium]|uniref:hypothetical protein n=1 Tax=Priestia megaterium TaxID=1404 RepID=UPI0018679D88|nr:hypothetical protein [Priestia megaterium]MBE2978799.1 hypothetical protein [Priestia megaterium]
MSDKDKQKVWVKFIIFTVVVGGIVAAFSVISDHLPPVTSMTTPELIVSYVAIMFNSLPGWFIMAMVVGYVFGTRTRHAACFGSLYIVSSITKYFVIGHFYSDQPDGVVWGLKDMVYIFITWYGASVIGGIIGGMVGFLFTKKPVVLVTLPAGLLLQLFLNGTRGWSDIVGMAQSITYCLIIISVFIYFFRLKTTKNKKVKHFA